MRETVINELNKLKDELLKYVRVAYGLGAIDTTSEALEMIEGLEPSEIRALGETMLASGESIRKLNKESGANVPSPWQQAYISAHHTFYNFVDQLPSPKLLSLEELLSRFSLFMVPGQGPLEEDVQKISDSALDSLYGFFVNSVKCDLLGYRFSDSFPVCRLTKVDHNKFLDNRNDSLKTRQEDALVQINGIYVSERGIFEEEHTKLCYLNFYVHGCMSEKSREDFSQTVSTLLRSLVRSLMLLSCDSGLIRPDLTLMWLLHSDDMPSLDEKTYHDNKELIVDLLSMYFKESKSKKDTFDRRIKNAIQLLIESDAQDNHAIGLALAITAIEAVLGKKQSNLSISEGVSTSVSVLLEPQTEFRAKAVAFLKRLYDSRSRVLHGEMLDNTPELRLQARHLATAVLFTTATHLDVSRKLGAGPKNPAELLKQLYDSRFSEGSTISTEKCNVNGYWRL